LESKYVFVRPFWVETTPSIPLNGILTSPHIGAILGLE
jgi:hypothetical protein